MPYPPFESITNVDGRDVVRSGKEPVMPLVAPSEWIDTTGKKIIIVLGKHKYYSLFNAQLMVVPLTPNGSLKGTVTPLNPLHFVWKESNVAMLRFYLAIIKFQTFYQRSSTDSESLKALVSNPGHYDIYFHDHQISEKITVRSLRPIHVAHLKPDVKVLVKHHNKTNTISCELKIEDTPYAVTDVTILYDYFITIDNRWYIIDDLAILKIISYFKNNGPVMYIANSEYEDFRQNVLSRIDLHVPLQYLNGANEITRVRRDDIEIEKIIYLSDLQNYVTITPVIKYGSTEIPVCSKRQLYYQDTKGNQVLIERHGELEDDFISLLLKQNEDFPEQLENPLLYFYIPKSYFLNPDWFLPMFEDWSSHNIKVFGFNQLTGHKFSPYKAKIRIEVSSGINWFNTQFDVKFGEARVSLSQINKALKNRNHYIELDNGTVGILPQEWVERFKTYFRVSENDDDYTLRLPKTNFTAIEELYEETELAPSVKHEIISIEDRINKISTTTQVTQPPSLLADLRPYQLQGLNWLNVLDDLNFGGCLADDMGLGKTVQIIAFILLIRAKKGKRTHLIVAPTSLLYSWKDEFTKFAPTVDLHVQYGANKINAAEFANHEVIITTYGTVLAEISSLASFAFDYIFLDESQHIKNPSSQRFRAVQLLQSRNRITISGTPFENSVWDLYAQFAFACPGLLGSRQYFRDSYAIPIGKFKEKRAAKILNKKIGPFILRRTKNQVASELPEKTEMILYCELSASQRELYLKEEKKFRDDLRTLTDDDIPKHAIQILKGLTRLRQICNSPTLLKDEWITEDEAGSGKLDLLIDRIASVCSNHKVLVFSQFVSMLDLIEKRLQAENINYTILTGQTRHREKIINNFQKDDEVRVFLISLKAGGTGLNLTAADYVFIVDPWWNPSVENQAIDRVYRIGQSKNVTAIRMICKNTIEEKMILIKESKSEIAKGVVREDDAVSLLTKENLMELIGMQVR
jgi:SNF2 family DNA or RNA helicase